ncbi:SET domain-containing protein [Venturia nashicola]|uniref:SET domain-containing protein n=1 Tax=Venturia nashicola TaxID=86259 RepID=A0A4Z1NVI9_9PEZI|nr:SET domain-containing protein [Venturia nashicola]TLD21041.1 SET domain-containing protein [Venturia nashicola]
MNVQEALMAWFEANGGSINPSITLAKDDAGGQHYRALGDIKTPSSGGLQVCYCPFGVTLSHLNVTENPPDAVKNCSRESVCSKLLGKIPTAAVSYFFLAEQRLKSAESFWAPYIDSLPAESEMQTPLWFDEEDLKWLNGTTLRAHTTDPSKSGLEMRRGMWKDQWQQGLEVLKNDGEDVDKFSWELYLWAATIFTSRSFTSSIMMPNELDSFALLYPLVDSFNHQFGSKVIWDMSNGNFALNITQPAKKGDEIFNNYAPKGNEELLTGYGFCMENNPCDVVAIRIGKPPESVHEALRAQFPTRFSSLDWSPDEATFFLRGSNHYTGGYDECVMPCLRGLPPEMYAAIRAILTFSYKAYIEGGEMTEADLDEASLQAIHDRLSEKRNAIIMWNSQLPHQPQNQKQAQAKIYREGQLSILEEILKELDTKLEELSKDQF